MAKNPTTIKDLTKVLHDNFKDEITAVPGETSLDTAIRILKAIVPAPGEGVGAAPPISVDQSIITSSIPPDKLLVDKRKFCEMFAALVKGYGARYNMGSGISLIGKMLSATNYAEEKAKYNECMNYLKQNN